MSRISIARLKRTTYPAFLLWLVFAFLARPTQAQITVSADKTAAILAGALVGTGVTIMSPVLNCPGNANGTYTTGVTDPLGMPNGIVLTNGCAKDTSISAITYMGINDPSSDFASRGNGTGGDVDLTALSGNPTFDACVLEFDFRAAGDTISFNYVFGSEEYTSFTCTVYNDVFGFFITGGAFTGPTNIALVPGTTIPVCINSVNCGPTGSGILSTCTALGTGSPFCAYYVDNLIGPASPYVTYDGLTTVLTAIAPVSPCDTYHLKLGVADAFDDILDSGVFIEGGSLSSTPPATLSSVGTGSALFIGGVPVCIRGCSPGRFNFTIPEARDSNIVVRYIISGSAVNGYDYATIADSVIIYATTLGSTVTINPLPVPAVGPKIVHLEIQVPDPCHPGVYTTGDTASIIILDSFTFRIITPDTSICLGEHVDINAIGDTLFGGILHYRWTPPGTLSDDTLLLTTATPVVTTTYTLRDSVPPVLGCPTKSRQITISVYNRPTVTTDSPYVKTCVGVPVDLHAYTGSSTIPYTYLWTPATALSSSTIYNPTVTPTTVGDVTYTVSVAPTAVPGCTTTDTIHVHTLGDFTLHNPDTAICIGQSVQVRVTGSSEFLWNWTPPDGVSSVTAMQPVITPTITTTYTVTARYAHCPDMVHSFNIEVDFPAPTAVYTDTICLGQTATYDFTSTIPGYYHYQWTPPTYISNDTIPNPVINPTTPGSYVWNITIQPNAAGCASFGQVNLLVTPNSISIEPADTAICRGNTVQVRATSYPLFTYQWVPTAGIALSTIINPAIKADTSDTYVVTATFSKCPDMHDTLRIDVQPNPVIYAGGSRTVCAYDTIRIQAAVSPSWYTHYHYQWTPAGAVDNDTMSTVIFYGSGAALPTTLGLTVSTPAGCTATDTVDVTVFPGNFAKMDPYLSFCPHDTAVLMPTGAASYSWHPGLYLSDSLSATPTIKPITNQTYVLIATSADGCRDTLSFTATVRPAATMYLADSVTLYPGETYQIEPQTNCVTFNWYPPAGLNQWTISNPIASPQLNTKYVVNATTEYGCKIKDSIMVYVDPETLITVPNAFTPGSDVNSEFKIIKRGIATLKYFRIFNRWGNLVFETTNIDEGWDGRYKGVPQPFGVFVYDIEAETSTGKIFKKHGNTTLIR